MKTAREMPFKEKTLRNFLACGMGNRWIFCEVSLQCVNLRQNKFHLGCIWLHAFEGGDTAAGEQICVLNTEYVFSKVQME